MTWLSHTEELARKLSTAIYTIRRIRQIVGESAALMTYHAMFHSKMTYGVRIWGESSHARNIFTLQKKAVRAIERVSQETHCRPLFRKFQIVTLAGTYIYQQLIRAKAELPLHGRRGQDTGLDLRNANRLTVPFHRTSTTSAQHRHLQLYNKLPASWLEKSTAVFQRDMKRLLKEQSFYTVEEFIQYFKSTQLL